jgi:hypothetical protein
VKTRKWKLNFVQKSKKFRNFPLLPVSTMKEENYHHGSGVDVDITGAKGVSLQKISVFCAPFFALKVSCPLSKL